MRTLILSLIVLLFNLSLSAQDIWNDYVIGRPMVNYYDAKKTIAKEWGINYQATFAGCVLSDEVSEKANAYEKSNKAYFEVLATKYGQNWQQDFALDVKKEMHRNSSSEKGTWYEVADVKQDKAFYTSKKVIAKTWGISYEAQFISANMTTSEKEALTERFLTNEDYMRQLENTFGQNWQDILNHEVDFELAKQAVASHDNVWIDYVVGKPYMAHFEAKKEVAKAWGINYEVQFKGCKLSKKLSQEIIKMEAKNVPYFKILEEHYGKDWNLRFNQAVQKEIAKKEG